MNKRQQIILNLLESKGEVNLQQLGEIFKDVSLMTLRRDLISLEEGGLLIRTHGGAVSARKLSVISGEEDVYSRRSSENVESKMKIAIKAVPMVEKGRSIYFDAGSTIMYLAKGLPDENFYIITSGTNIALELVKKTQISVMTLGGLVNRNTLSVSGPNATSLLDTVNIDMAFMAASGFSIDSGFTVSNIYECELKRKVVERAKRVVVLMDTNKINRSLPFTYAKLEDINALICERELPPEVESEARKHNVQII